VGESAKVVESIKTHRNENGRPRAISAGMAKREAAAAIRRLAPGEKEKHGA
jgi:hypothetical protein